MNFQNIVNEIEKVDPEVYGRFDTRRNVMKQFANISGKIAAAAVPTFLGAMFSKAYGQSTPATVTSVLNFALTLEFLEAQFYANIIASSAVASAPAAAQSALKVIANDEAKHVAALQGVLGTAAVAKPTFDFSGGSGSGNGPFATYLTNYDMILAMAQTFEDTGVRAYKGQAGNLNSNRTALTYALQIHSVEARHASHIRQMRRAQNNLIPAGQVVKPWITLNQTGISFPPADAAIQMSYNGEDLTMQAGANIVGIGGNTFIDANAASASFDEPLDMPTVLGIVKIFIKP